MTKPDLTQKISTIRFSGMPPTTENERTTNRYRPNTEIEVIQQSEIFDT